MKRVLVLGGTGMLGHKLVQHLASERDVWTTVRLSSDELRRYDICRADRMSQSASLRTL